MAYLVLGALALWLVLRFSRQGRLPRREWRFITAIAAVAAFAAAAAAGLRQAWPIALTLAAMGVWLALSSRQPPGAAPAAPPPQGMSLDEARRVLGVGPDATKKDIQAAYLRLMQSVHPDRGGTAGLAAQLNAARDRLLDR